MEFIQNGSTKYLITKKGRAFKPHQKGVDLPEDLVKGIKKVYNEYYDFFKAQPYHKGDGYGRYTIKVYDRECRNKTIFKIVKQGSFERQLGRFIEYLETTLS